MKLKKSLGLILIILSTLSIISCKNSAKETKSTTKQEQELSSSKTTKKENTEVASLYACPMHCEGDKTYSEKGNCPVCKMDLTLQEAPKEKMCQCKKGECKCKEGACKCGTPGYDHFGNKV